MIGILKAALAEKITPAELAAVLVRHEPDLSPDDAAALAEVCAPFVITMADAAAWAIEAALDPRGGRAIAFATGSVLCYLFKDEDLLPESAFGALGLIDDAFLVHAFVERVRQAFPFVAAPTGYTPPGPDAVRLAATLLPDGVATALIRMCDSLLHVGAALFSTPGTRDGAGTVEPVIRASAAAELVRASSGSMS